MDELIERIDADAYPEVTALPVIEPISNDRIKEELGALNLEKPQNYKFLYYLAQSTLTLEHKDQLMKTLNEFNQLSEDFMSDLDIFLSQPVSDIKPGAKKGVLNYMKEMSQMYLDACNENLKHRIEDVNKAILRCKQEGGCDSKAEKSIKELELGINKLKTGVASKKLSTKEEEVIMEQIHEINTEVVKVSQYMSRMKTKIAKKKQKEAQKHKQMEQDKKEAKQKARHDVNKRRDDIQNARRFLRNYQNEEALRDELKKKSDLSETLKELGIEDRKIRETLWAQRDIEQEEESLRDISDGKLVTGIMGLGMMQLSQEMKDVRNLGAQKMGKKEIFNHQ